ncbi:MAG: Hpt domain-containing protein [Parvularculaceae bacterium]
MRHDGIDLKHLERYVAGDDALRDEILMIFVDQAERWARELKSDLGDEEWRDACHALKGAARGVGAWRLGDLAAEGEALKTAAAAKAHDVAKFQDEILSAIAESVASATAARALVA